MPRPPGPDDRARRGAGERNPSIVLERAWIRALIDAGELERAGHEIERHMAVARWKSAWLILRAQVRGELHDYEGRKADAATALAELGERLHPRRPDPVLLAEAVEARKLLAE